MGKGERLSTKELVCIYEWSMDTDNGVAWRGSMGGKRDIDNTLNNK